MERGPWTFVLSTAAERHVGAERDRRGVVRAGVPFLAVRDRGTEQLAAPRHRAIVDDRHVRVRDPLRDAAVLALADGLGRCPSRRTDGEADDEECGLHRQSVSTRLMINSWASW